MSAEIPDRAEVLRQVRADFSRIIAQMNLLIMITPTGETRNAICDAQMFIYLAEDDIKGLV